MNEALSLISRAKSFLLLPHYLPDVDAMGSAVALAMGLKQKGKKVEIFSPSTLSAPVAALLKSLEFEIINKPINSRLMHFVNKTCRTDRIKNEILLFNFIDYLLNFSLVKAVSVSNVKLRFPK